jgi:hypothetical protein
VFVKLSSPHLVLPALALAILLGHASAQTAAPSTEMAAQTQSAPPPGTHLQTLKLAQSPAALLPYPSTGVPPSLGPLFELSNTEIKFQLPALMTTLRDNRHEGWVLVAYPDPKTSRPLIGAGFSLDLEARQHIQGDPINPHPFLEPSSAELWQAAGLEPVRLQRMLDQYDSNLAKWGKKKYRKKISKQQLPSDISDEESLSLLRISVVQAIYNAQAYCREFNQLTGSQQMALTQLVYQMGVNLEEFTTFLAILNQSPHLENVALNSAATDQRQYWEAVQLSLIQSQWARKYSSRAISVIAMLDPNYAESPRASEQRVQAVLKPAKHHHKKKKAASSRA